MSDTNRQYFVDIGNTRIKHAANREHLSTKFAKHDEVVEVISSIEGYKSTEIVATAGRSEQCQQALQAIQDWAHAKKTPVTIVAVDNRLLRVNYQDSSQFGVDRYLNILAARQRLCENFCVVSCGTAITLDFYTTEHIGGMIALGLGSARQLLQGKTGLSSIEKPTDLLGNSTASSIGSGLYFGYKNLILRSIESVEKQLNLSLQVIYTGGDAEVLSDGGSTLPNLLFEGMQTYITYITRGS